MNQVLEEQIQQSLTNVLDMLAEQQAWYPELKMYAIDFEEPQDMSWPLQEAAEGNLKIQRNGWIAQTDSKTWYHYSIGLLVVATMILSRISRRQLVVGSTQAMDCIKDYVRLHVVRRPTPGLDPVVRLNKRDRQRLKRFVARYPFTFIEYE